jgi:ATP-dependent Clp protease ATP-binding subunit ClpA
MGYDPEMGARPLKRVIQQNIEDTLSDSLLAGEFEDGDTIIIDAVDEEISLYKNEEKPIEEKEEEVLTTG